MTKLNQDPLPNRPKPCNISVSVADEWLAEHGNGMDRLPKSPAFAKARRKTKSPKR